jgi:fumarylacetoacetase
MVLLNDWSSRHPKWEYVPLGPFFKNFASLFPLIVTMDALEPFRTKGPKQEPTHFPTCNKGKHSFDINLNIQPENAKPTVVSHSNFKYLYWSMCQQLAHHTSNGCRVNSEI